MLCLQTSLPPREMPRLRAPHSCPTTPRSVSTAWWHHTSLLCMYLVSKSADIETQIIQNFVPMWSPTFVLLVYISACVCVFVSQSIHGEMRSED